MKVQPVYKRKDFDKLTKKEKQSSFTVTDINNKWALKKLHKAIIETLTLPNEAEAWEQYKQEAKGILKKYNIRGIPIKSLAVSFRVARNNAYNQGIIAKASVLQKQGKLFGLLYHAVHDSETRINHGAADGVLRPLGDPFWEIYTPANGFNCRCWLQIITKDMAGADDMKYTPEKDLPTPELKPDPGFD